MTLPLFNDFERIVLEDLPLIDVRAPVEFAGGSFPTAINLPLLDDEERRLVGIRYKQAGQDAAIELGHRLVSGEVKEARIRAWLEFLDQHPNALIYCFRGGQRSRIAQEWIHASSGRAVPRLEGGYKAFRRWLIERLSPESFPAEPLLIGGRTGVGKTRFLRQWENFLDLEAIANHRGSSFGRFPTPQPVPIDFENRIAWQLVKFRAAGFEWIFIEDEGRHIGRCFLPKPLAEFLSRAPVVVLERSLEERIQITFEEYILDARRQYETLFGKEAGIERWREWLQESLDRLRKRLGGARHQELRRLMDDAFAAPEDESHKVWIERLLTEYYDPMYDYQLQRKQPNIIFRGGPAEVRDFLASRVPPKDAHSSR